MSGIQRMMVKLIDKPVMFLLATIGVFLVLTLIAAVVYYVLACMWNKKTDMTGTMNVAIALNLWPEDRTGGKNPILRYGNFNINMAESSLIVGPRLNGPRNWKEKIFCRRYAVSLLVDRFWKKYKVAGMSADPSAQMLEELLGMDEFCAELGTCFQKSARKGLQAAESVFQKKSGSQVCVYCDLSRAVYGAAVGKYVAATGCAVQSICVTLDYQG